MIQIRDVFQVKFGKIDQATQLFGTAREFLKKESADVRSQVLVDMSGDMYTLVNEVEAPSLGKWEATRDWLFDHEGYPDWFRQFQLLVENGRREYYVVEHPNAGWSSPGVVVVRNVFRALKWQIRPTVELLNRYGALLEDSGVGRRARILTDASGKMFTAVIEIETPGLSEWEQHRRGMFQRPEFQVWFTQLCANVSAGRHEFFTVV